MESRRVDALIARFTEDALIMVPRGGVTRGHDDIRRLLSPMVASGVVGTAHDSEIVGIEYVFREKLICTTQVIIITKIWIR